MRQSLARVLVAALLFVALVPSRWSFGQSPRPAPPPLQLKVGDSAPGFVLRDQIGEEVALKDFLGKKTVVLAFYVFAFTSG
jgi:cytochrome oxidase Cu insertion factor (SCO1/SenC/PrrC family)